jgi:hypothetical protein
MPAIFPAATSKDGTGFAMPDVNLTPGPSGPIPVPYPNTAMFNQAKKKSRKVKFAGKAALKIDSEILRSMGDEAGLNKGVISGVNMGKVTFIKGSAKVRIQGKPCLYLTCPTRHNGMNANAPAGAHITPSQDKVIVSP